MPSCQAFSRSSGPSRTATWRSMWTAMAQPHKTEKTGCMARRSSTSKTQGRGSRAPSFFCVKPFYSLEKISKKKSFGSWRLLVGFTGGGSPSDYPPPVCDVRVSTRYSTERMFDTICRKRRYTQNKRNNRPYKTLNVWVYRYTPKAIHGEKHKLHGQRKA